jgi:cytidine deaminase
VSGKVFSGCNIENVSFGLTICAERAALAQMVSAGEREIETIYVVTRDGGSPCGMCRQTLIEFLSPEKDAQVFVEAEGGTVKEYSLRSLLPASFNAELDKLPG